MSELVSWQASWGPGRPSVPWGAWRPRGALGALGALAGLGALVTVLLHQHVAQDGLFLFRTHCEW